MQQQHVVIVGAGIIGLATAYNLLRQGMHQVTVLEQETVDHGQASSHGISRLLRFEYGTDTFYPEMVRLSLKRWQQLEQYTGQRLYTPTGTLGMGRGTDSMSEQSYRTLHGQGYPLERLSHSAVAQRFPQFCTQGYDFLSYHANAGMLHASLCLQTLRTAIREMGGTILEYHQATAIRHDNIRQPICIQLAARNEIVADRVVIAAGPWVHRILRDEIDLPIQLTRQYLLYFANLPLKEFSLPAFPAFMADDLYGFPIHKHGNNGPAWLKAASHTFGAPAEPGEVPVIDEQVIKDVTQRLYQLIPALRKAELAKVESYIYDVSLDEDFILDYLPQDRRIVLATGFTGHAFKFGILLGELLSSLVCDEEPLVPLTRFRLARFAHQWRIPTPSVA
ncbi:FAD-dependent oxidoreductase [Dictyobacter aurantiacus]|uniref:N-methyl-L-tryptophan oxidase n=1 Tax=Dictyobacter aurantiacus TaxID=1936993 RepID=A0A401ZH02_9CHLR|nr:FAD-dependent oxidoreductase [Dictyobacter aurantiacus]GCE06165.1 N-methyl-L-tryptophan oxidase [Dictyobacter aurantiacus]